MHKTIEIIQNSDDFIVINKLPNINCHQLKNPDPVNQSDLLGLFYQLSQQIGQPLWPVHRLDKMTSGLLIMAKNKPAAQLFGQLFESRQIEKSYLAISAKKPNKKQGKIIGDMKKSRSGNWKLCHSKENPAITRFKSYPLGDGKRLFLLHPKTGKTHQIRVALKSIGAPIIGDPRYATGNNCGENPDRGYLHAFQLIFKWKGQKTHINCPPTQGRHFLHASCKETIQAFL